MAAIERQYEYKPKWTVIILVAVFFGLCALVTGAQASRNDRGLVINGLIALGRDGATLFYWILTAASVGFVIAAAFLAGHRVAYRQHLVFRPNALIAPTSRWSRNEKEIAYRDVLGLSLTNVSGQRFLYISHRGGRYTITASMLPSETAFDEVCELLTAMVNECQPDTGIDKPVDGT